MNRKMFVLPVLCFVLLVFCFSASSVSAASFREVPFDEMVRASGLIIEATVIRMSTEEVTTAGKDPPRSKGDSPRSPVSARSEGGRMVLTRVTLSLERIVKGSHPRILQLTMPGGTHGDIRVTIPGLPVFETGRRYFLFLGPDYETSGVPFVGVSQGFLRIMEDPATGDEWLEDIDAQDVMDVRAGRVIGRSKKQQSSVMGRAKGPLPHPAPGYKVVVPIEGSGLRQDEAAAAKPLTPDDMEAIIRSVPGWDAAPKPRGGQKVLP